MSARIAFVFATEDHDASSGSISLAVADSASKFVTNEERAPHERVLPKSFSSCPVFFNRSDSSAS